MIDLEVELSGRATLLTQFLRAVDRAQMLEKSSASHALYSGPSTFT